MGGGKNTFEEKTKNKPTNSKKEKGETQFGE